MSRATCGAGAAPHGSRLLLVFDACLAVSTIAREPIKGPPGAAPNSNPYPRPRTEGVRGFESPPLHHTVLAVLNEDWVCLGMLSRDRFALPPLWRAHLTETDHQLPVHSAGHTPQCLNAGVVLTALEACDRGGACPDPTGKFVLRDAKFHTKSNHLTGNSFIREQLLKRSTVSGIDGDSVIHRRSVRTPDGAWVHTDSLSKVRGARHRRSATAHHGRPGV